MHSIELPEFLNLAAQYDLVPIYRRMLGDVHTPVSAFFSLDEGGACCLFESVIGGEKVGRYSFLGTHPTMRFTATGRSVTWSDAESTSRSYETDDPFEELRTKLSPSVAPVPGLPPFIGGAVGYAAYDSVRYVEQLPDQTEDDRHLPDLDFSFYQSMVIFDNVKKITTVVTLAQGKSNPTESSYQAALRTLDAIVHKLTHLSSEHPFEMPLNNPVPSLPLKSNFTREQFCEAVNHCIEYIHAGDIFQVVPSQRFEIKTSVPSIEIYRSLRVVNPSPFMFFVRTGSVDLIGCSPEIMCRVWDGEVTVRPLAGTRRRESIVKKIVNWKWSCWLILRNAPNTSCWSI